MKSAIICFKCHGVRKYTDSYAVKILDTTDLMELSVVKKEKTFIKLVPKSKEVRVCRTCIKRMGYKIKVKK